MNDAMITVLMSKPNALNLRRNFFHRELRACFETGGVNQISDRGVANLMHPSSVLKPELDHLAVWLPRNLKTKNKSPTGKKPVGLLNR